MPSKFRRGIKTIKDHVVINTVSPESCGEYYKLLVPLLKATTHKEVIPDKRNIAYVIDMVVSSTRWASACVRNLHSCLSRTTDYVVALKCLIVTFHALREGGPYFALEAKQFYGHPGPRHFLDMSEFFTSRTYSSTPWDYTAFVRTYAWYLKTRLELAIQGKLQNLYFRERMLVNPIDSMTPFEALAHVEHWQLLLNHAISIKPTGPSCNNHLVQFALDMVVRETFNLCEDISASLNLLLEKFASLDRECRIKTIESCHATKKQFEELDSFYAYCIKIGVGKATEYPRVQTISKTLGKKLEEHMIDVIVN